MTSFAYVLSWKPPNCKSFSQHETWLHILFKTRNLYNQTVLHKDDYVWRNYSLLNKSYQLLVYSLTEMLSIKEKTIQNGEIIQFVDYHSKEKFIDIFGILDTWRGWRIRWQYWYWWLLLLKFSAKYVWIRSHAYPRRAKFLYCRLHIK